MPTKKEIKYPSLLSNLFSSAFTDRVIANAHTCYLQGIFKQTGFDQYMPARATVSYALQKAFNYLATHYRGEYVFKTAIFKEALIQHHGLKSTCFLTEFRSANAKADILLLNGTSIAYEIKSDIDRLDRLGNQTAVYQYIFDKVIIVSSIEHLTKVIQLVPLSVGISVLAKNSNIVPVRHPTSNVPYLKKDLMFDCLRKPEYLSLIQSVFHSIPDVPSTRIHTACKSLFCSLSNEEAHHHFVTVLKRRQFSQDQMQLIRSTRHALQCLLADKIYSPKECELLKFGLTQQLTF